MIHGRNLIVALDGVAVAGSKSCSLQLSQNFIEACAPNSGRVHEKIPTTYEWSVSVDCLVPNSNLPVSLKDKLIAGTKCLLTFTDGDGDNRAGFVYVKSCDESGTVGSLATFKASFEPSGALYKYQELSFGTIQGGDTFAIHVENDGTILYDFQASGTETLGLQVTPTTKSMLFVKISEDWAVFKNTLEQIEVFIANQHDDYLNEWLVACGWRNSKVIPLETGKDYTVLIDDHASNPRICWLLYE